MIFASKQFGEVKRPDSPRVSNPESIQDTIEIYGIAEDGIFDIGKNRYSKTYFFTDINYATSSEEEQYSMLIQYCTLLNSIGVRYKITMNNKNRNMQRFKEELLLAYKNDGFDENRKMINNIINRRVSEGKQGVEQERYITLVCTRNSYEEAKACFAMLETNLRKNFQSIGSVIVPLHVEDRMQVLHDVYCMGNEDEFQFDFQTSVARAEDFKNAICNNRLEIKEDYLKSDNYYMRSVYIQTFPSALSDQFLKELVNMPIKMLFTIDVEPIDLELVKKTLNEKYMGIEEDIRKQQKIRNKNRDFASEISYSKALEKEDLKEIIDDVRNNDQNMFYVGVTIIIIAETKEQLDQNTESIVTTAKGKSVTIKTHYLRQLEGLNTALPIGVRQVDTMRSMLTKSLAALVPFNVQELCLADGIFYGVNHVSKNVIMGNRKKLINGNGWFIGVSGSGKSMESKFEISQVYLNTDDDIIIIDPMNGATRWQLKRLSTYASRLYKNN